MTAFAADSTFYRSKHELVLVWKVKPCPHVNSFGLGETGCYRTNVWDYAGVNTFGANRDADLAMHPTVKPVALIGDAIRDYSRRGDVVLDMFGGSGRPEPPASAANWLPHFKPRPQPRM